MDTTSTTIRPHPQPNTFTPWLQPSRWLHLFFLVVLITQAMFTQAQSVAANTSALTGLPAELKAWQQWVLHDHPNAACPFIYNTTHKTPPTESNRACLWPSYLHLNLNNTSGHFTFNVDAFSEQWLLLPGGDNAWPVKVKNKTSYLPVTQKNGRPAVLLKPGHHVIEGMYQWKSTPRTLSIPPEKGLLTLTLNGKNIVNPNIDAQGKLWLSQKNTVVKKEAQRDTLSAKVFRHLDDSTPQVLTTVLQMNISGREREVQLGPFLLPNTTPRVFNSPLPARIEPNGALRIQVKPGRYSIELIAHTNQPTNTFTFTPQNEWWPTQELWAFSAQRNLRTVQLEGSPVIDASQTQLPDEWKHLPTYLLTPDSVLTLNELHRGDPKPATNDLFLDKTLWLDFNGEGYTVSDEISGTMHQGWRLETSPPYELARAEVEDTPQLITTLSEAGPPGIEVRVRELELTALSRVPALTTLPVSGWQQEFDSVDANIELPPGWSAFFISGADSVRGAWLTAWNLWDIFLVLVIAVSLARVVNIPVGLLALATVVLVYQREQAPIIGWLNITAGLALLPYIKGRFAKMVCGYLALSFIGLLLIILPFAVQEARLAMYPQLEVHNQFHTPARQKERKPSPRAEYDSSTMQDANIEEVLVTGIRASSKLQRVQSFASGPDSYQAAYDPGQKVQVGPGIPDWQWERVSAHWSGPVHAGETTQVVLVSPFINRLGHGLSIVLVAALFVMIFQKFWRYTPAQYFTRPRINAPASTAAVLLCALGLTSLHSPNANANVVIDKELLSTLELRLLTPPQCQSTCAAIEATQLRTHNETLTIDLTINTLVDMAFPLPGNSEQWWPQKVTLNQQTLPLLQTRNQRLFVYVPKGRHTLTLKGAMTGMESIPLEFQLPLHNVTTQLSDWAASGLPSANQSSQNVQLHRVQKVKTEEEKSRLLPDPIAPFVQITRHIELGLEWNVSTVVTRIAPSQGPIHLALPLIPGEAPTNGELKSPGVMDVRFGNNQRSVHWRSNLPVTETLTLTAPNNAQWSEVWSIKTSPLWHTAFNGIPSVAQNGDNVWPLWHPRPNETLTTHISRPQPTQGRQLAIDEVMLEYNLGARASDANLTLELRSTAGNQLDLPLPENATLKHVIINGTETPISQVDNQLKIPIVPGNQTVQLQWQTPVGAHLKTQTPEVTLSVPAANIHLSVNLPHNRWILAVGGPSLGPAILFWGVLAIVIALAVALGKSQLTPLKAYEWVLLSLGVATFNLMVLALVAACFIVLTLRGKRNSPPFNRQFNLQQVGLFIFTAVAFIALISSVPSSLLSSPEMYITGNNSHAYTLNWYQDQSLTQLPQAWVISLPMLTYKLIMLLWSLWLAFALMRWIRWGWQQLGVQGYWFTQTKEEPNKNKSES